LTDGASGSRVGQFEDAVELVHAIEVVLHNSLTYRNYRHNLYE